MSLFRAKTVQQRPLLPREVELSNRLAGLNEWNDVSEEVIDSKILVGLLKKNLRFIVAIGGELLSGLSSNARFHVQIQDTDYTKQRSIDTMTPNKLAVYIVANIDFPSGRYRLAVADIVYGLWPIWPNPNCSS